MVIVVLEITLYWDNLERERDRQPSSAFSILWVQSERLTNVLLYCGRHHVYLEGQLFFVSVLAAKHFSKCSLTKFGEG